MVIETINKREINELFHKYTKTISPQCSSEIKYNSHLNVDFVQKKYSFTNKLIANVIGCKTYAWQRLVHSGWLKGSDRATSDVEREHGYLAKIAI